MPEIEDKEKPINLNNLIGKHEAMAMAFALYVLSVSPDENVNSYIDTLKRMKGIYEKRAEDEHERGSPERDVLAGVVSLVDTLINHIEQFQRIRGQE